MHVAWSSVPFKQELGQVKLFLVVPPCEAPSVSHPIICAFLSLQVGGSLKSSREQKGEKLLGECAVGDFPSVLPSLPPWLCCSHTTTPNSGQNDAGNQELAGRARTHQDIHDMASEDPVLTSKLWSRTWQSEVQPRFWMGALRGKVHPAYYVLLPALLCAVVRDG